MRNDLEDMVRWLTVTLISTIHGINLAEYQMQLLGEGDNHGQILAEYIRNSININTPNQKLLLARQLAFLTVLANTV